MGFSNDYVGRSIRLVNHLGRPTSGSTTRAGRRLLCEVKMGYPNTRLVGVSLSVTKEVKRNAY
ncbi:MAG: hypothetical protein Aurels2KO_43100 [Aureliella sp.]